MFRKSCRIIVAFCREYCIRLFWSNFLSLSLLLSKMEDFNIQCSFATHAFTAGCHPSFVFPFTLISRSNCCLETSCCSVDTFTRVQNNLHTCSVTSRNKRTRRHLVTTVTPPGMTMTITFLRKNKLRFI